LGGLLLVRMHGLALAFGAKTRRTGQREG
jgi:hypothetical protein